MLFSSNIFLFAFLPAALTLFYLSRKFWNGRIALSSLALMSLLFYSVWNPPYVLLLICSIGANYLFARRLTKHSELSVLCIAIFLNLATLAYYKYSAFFLDNIAAIAGYNWSIDAIVLPLAISFFTFQQIALLVDVYSKDTKVDGFLDYAVFIAFFPQLIAGPIVLHHEMALQIERMRKGVTFIGGAEIGAGLLVFSFGLFKKVCLADPLGRYSNIVFGFSDQMSLLEIWFGSVAFMIQIYFDFSGYSDMAIGLGLLFGFRLPLNFNQPYRATSFVDYWKRWHMTMTRFFMLYVLLSHRADLRPQDGRRWWMVWGPVFLLSVVVPTLITFIVAGLWHGAEWTFVMFGLANGIFLSLNHIWRFFVKIPIPNLFGWALTMMSVLVTLIYFRAPSVEIAHDMFIRMVNPEFSGSAKLGHLNSQNLPRGALKIFPSGGESMEMITMLVCFRHSCARSSKSRPLTREDKTDVFYGNFHVPFCSLFRFGFLDRPQAFIYFQFLIGRGQRMFGETAWRRYFFMVLPLAALFVIATCEIVAFGLSDQRRLRHPGEYLLAGHIEE